LIKEIKSSKDEYTKGELNLDLKLVEQKIRLYDPLINTLLKNKRNRNRKTKAATNIQKTFRGHQNKQLYEAFKNADREAYNTARRNNTNKTKYAKTVRKHNALKKEYTLPNGTII
jgi:hypothetical protein